MRQIHWRLEDGSWLRITVGELSVMANARFRQLLREGADWTEANYGFRTQTDLEPENITIEIDLAEALYARAAMISAVRSVECGTAAEGKERPETWEPSELPEAWQSIDGFLNELPGALYKAWQNVANEVNPGLFWLDADLKKSDRLFVT